MVAPFSRSHTARIIRDARIRRQQDDDSVPRDPALKNHPSANTASGGIWNGWNAALILSKQKGLPALAGNGSIEKTRTKESKRELEPSTVKWRLTGRVGNRKRKRTETLNLQQRNSAVNKDNDDSALEHPTAFSFDEMGEEDIKLFKEGVEALTMHALVEVSYLRLLKELLGDDSYRRFVESLFRSVAKFVLSVFDKEDFERICHENEISVQWQNLCSLLRPETGISEEEFVRRTVEKLIKESHRFPALRDHDICQILAYYAKNADAFATEIPRLRALGINCGDCKCYPFKFSLSHVEGNSTGNNYSHHPISRIMKKGELQEDDISKSFRNNAINEVMQNFVHLKENYKTQLGLELMYANGYRVFDTLVIEVLKDIEIDCLFELCHKIPRPTGDGSFLSVISNARVVVSRVLFYFVKALNNLGWLKSTALKYSQDGVASSLSYAFGPCKAEVIEVIKIADHERRLNNKFSISLENIKYGLSLSRVGDFVKRIPGGSPPTFSIIEFFRISRQKASNMGDKKVGLHHLVLAMNAILRKELTENASLVPDDEDVVKHLKCLMNRNMNKQQVRRSWKEYSPISIILHSRYRVLTGGTYVGAGPPIKCVRKLRNCPKDMSWIRKDMSEGH